MSWKSKTQKCDGCDAPTREVDPKLMTPENGHIKIGAISIHISERLENPAPYAIQLKEAHETKRYCPACAKQVKNLLSSLGFKTEAA